MASAGVNVLRYSVLGAGVVYGFLHQSKLSSAAKHSAIQKEYDHKVALITQAKAEYLKRTAPSNPKAASNTAIFDPESPKFDLEAYINKISTDGH
ncbi:unnamed protein product [Blumeria hordei]|uniref:ATP synthase F(0) complex subunit e, mitochondrial n=2 Tax=Blumeria hordei TaxID=2867405 RepID=A0A383UWW8_BLUHO|nr:hypothetical protein BGHDH14_bgh02135 [Blumeria hordei DH14]SZF04854.1 unnamed protein product [Blumeria hordei]